MSDTDTTYETGLNLRRDMFGKEQTDDRIAQAGDFDRPFEDMITRYCFGEVWSRPTLDRKTRSMLTLAILTALGRQNQVVGHVEGAIRNGVSKEEIREVFLHAMIYAGVPAAVNSFATAKDVFKKMGLEDF